MIFLKSQQKDEKYALLPFMPGSWGRPGAINSAHNENWLLELRQYISLGRLWGTGVELNE